jgi:glycosyltransferase involved in cell wall biosynthesis
MSCGIPVVTTSLGPEDYAIDGNNALIVPPRKPEMMASAILRLMKDEFLRRRLSQNAVATAAMLTWDRSANELEQIFGSSTG